MAAQVAVSALAGAGFELLFDDLLKMVLIVQKNNSQFKPSLERLQKMIEDMAPNINRIETFIGELDQPQQLERLLGLMSDGRDSVRRCSKIHKYNYLKRPIYNKKLLKLEKDIRDHINIVLQLQGVADTEEILVEQNWNLGGVINVSSGVQQLSNQVSYGVTQLRDDIGRLRTTLSNVDRVDSSNANFEVHPLPLPAGAAVPSPSVSVSIALHKPEFPPMKSQWQKGKLIGRGTFGSVYVASNRETGALCAMKEVEMFPDDPRSAESIKQLEQENKVLTQLKHPNIVQYYGSEVVDDKFYIYLEYVHPGSINKYVHEHCGAITESVVRNFSRHIVSGLAYLHSMKTIHRDIKGANLLVDASGIVKLADFGMAKLLTGQAADLSLKGSPYWMAPELMQAVMRKDASSDLALAVDIWSLGCTIIEMFTGKPPWSEYEGAAAMFKVMRDSPAIPEILSPEGKDFLRCCFRRNPAERPTAAMLLEHRWLKSCQQVDVSSTMQSINGINLTDISHIRRASEFKFDLLPGLPSSKSIEGKATSDSYMHYSFYPARLSDDLAMKLPS